MSGMEMSRAEVNGMSACCWVYREQKLHRASSLFEALGLDEDEPAVISVVGGGGKTTTLHRLADEYVRVGKKVVAATTTHIQKEDEPWFLADPSAEEVKESLERYGQTWVGTPVRGGRLGQMEDQLFSQILSWKIPVLIEADGARRHPMKIPAGHEPVIIPQTTHLLNVYGIETVGKTMEEVCFRLELAEQFLGKTRSERITYGDIVKLASSEQAGKKGCPDGAKYTVFINKADRESQRQDALEICRLLEKAGITHVVVTGQCGEVSCAGEE